MGTSWLYSGFLLLGMWCIVLLTRNFFNRIINPQGRWLTCIAPKPNGMFRSFRRLRISHTATQGVGHVDVQPQVRRVASVSGGASWLYRRRHHAIGAWHRLTPCCSKFSEPPAHQT